MNRTVEKDRTLLVDGPASVLLISGKAEVFGATMTNAGRVVIREGKRLPFVVREKTTFDISLGESAMAEEVEGDTIPPSWTTSWEELMAMSNRPVLALVLGKIDSGKSSFCTYLVNKALSEKKKVAIIDGDLGQSDIGPPCTLAYNLISKPITDLFNVQAKDAIFVGFTSPSRVTSRVVEALLTLKNESLTGDPDLLVVNTDGWVEGECAVNHKLELARVLAPQIIFCIQQKDESMPMCDALDSNYRISVESPQAIRQKDMEKRKSLRELGYLKYLKGSKVKSLSLGWIEVQGSELFDLCPSHPSARQTSKICSLLGMKPLHVAELGDRIHVVIGRRRWIEENRIKKLEEFAQKRVVVTRKGEEEGIFAGLYSPSRKFLGVGVLQEIDYLRGILKICTPVPGEIGILALGNVKLDRNMKEIPDISEEKAVDFATLRKLF